MKNRTIAFLFALLLLCSGGISAVVTLAKEDIQATKELSKDRLIGVYVTTEYVSLMDMEKFIDENFDTLMSGNHVLSPEDTAGYTEKLYAVEKTEDAISPLTGETYTTHDLIFPGIDGFGSYCYKAEENGSPVNISGGLGAICDRRFHFKTTDHGEEFALEGTIYTCDSFDNALYFNPIYQSADGSIYLLPGTGIHHGGIGLSSFKLSEEETAESNGETVTAYRSDITINIENVLPPEMITVLQFSADNIIISQTKYTQDTLPQTIVPLENAEYILIECYPGNKDGEVARELYSKTDTALDIFVHWKDGICEKKSVQLEWN